MFDKQLDLILKFLLEVIVLAGISSIGKSKNSSAKNILRFSTIVSCIYIQEGIWLLP